MRQSQLIVTNAVIKWITRVFLVVPQLILVPYLLSTIGESGYGVYALAWPLLLSIERMHRSLQSGVVKYSAGFLAQDKLDRVNQVVSSSFLYSLILGLLAGGGTALAAVYYGDPTGQINAALRVIAIMLVLIFPLTPFIAVIQARQRYYIGTIADTASKYLSLLAIYAWFELFTPSAQVVVSIMVISLFLSRLIQIPFAYRLVPGLKNRLSNFDREDFRLMAGFGLGTIFAAISLGLNSTGVRWLMEVLVSSSFVAQLAIMIMPASLLSDIISAMIITIMPATSAYQATGNQKLLRELFIRSMRYSALMILPAAFAAWVLMEDALRLWVGVEYIFLAPYALVLFLSQGFRLIAQTSAQMLKGTGEIRKFVVSNWIGLVIIPLGAILAIFYTDGNPYRAVIGGLSLGYLLGGILQLYLGVRMISASLKRMVVKVFWEPAAAGLFFGAAWLLGRWSGLNGGLIGRLIVLLTGLVLYGLVVYFYVLSGAEKDQGWEMLQELWKRVKKIFPSQKRR